MIGIYDIDKVCDIDYKKRLKIYKDCGFNEVALYLDNTYLNENENYIDIISHARKLNLQVKQVHIDYKISNLICDKTSNEYFDYVSQKLGEAINFNISYVVAHASMSNQPPQIDQVQLEKFKSMMNKFENTGNIYYFKN